MTALHSGHFEKMFGGPLDLKTRDEIHQHDWRYEVVSNHDAIILDLLKRIERKDFSIVGQNNERWQAGWSENLAEFRKTGDIKALEPKYLRPSKYLRLNSQFIEPVDPMFERNWYRVFRGWFARRYLSQYDGIYEFGCGSGHNLAFLAQEFPDKMLCGFDWSPAAVEIARELANVFPNILGGERFDFFDPYGAYGWPPNTAVLTIGALEQTGTRWRPFINFLRRTRPAMCFHIEPMLGWYNPNNLVDWTAIKIHEARGFWSGFDVFPLHKHRTGFGSLLLEGYSQFHWSPMLPEISEQARIDALEGAP